MNIRFIAWAGTSYAQPGRRMTKIEGLEIISDTNTTTGGFKTSDHKGLLLSMQQRDFLSSGRFSIKNENDTVVVNYTNRLIMTENKNSAMVSLMQAMSAGRDPVTRRDAYNFIEKSQQDGAIVFNSDSIYFSTTQSKKKNSSYMYTH